jgi:hypothetical protein
MQDWANKWYNKQKKQQQKRIQKKVVDPIHYYHNDAIYYMNST